MRQPRRIDPVHLGSDWSFAWTLLDREEWTEDDEVVLTMNPDAVSWEDYGMHSRYFPDDYSSADYWQASSEDDTAYVTLDEPNIITLAVPYSILGPMGPGVVNVALSLRDLETGARNTVFSGRLPLVAA